PEGLGVEMPNLERLYVLHGAASQRAALVDALRNHPFVVFAEKDVGAVGRLIPDDPRFHLQWAVNDEADGTASPVADIRAIAAWDITQGSAGVSIGIMDPGPPAPGGGRVWDAHPELQGRVSGELNAPVGEHATVVAGVAAARRNNGQGIAGVDWNAQIVTRAFQGGGEFVDDMYYMIENGVDVVNHSWGQAACEYNITTAWAGALAYKANLLNVVAMPEDLNTRRRDNRICEHHPKLHVWLVRAGRCGEQD
ncbi:MAG: S8 family serine peptidase, partial [Candidatus Latescibacteria bacterium]|nr:S8 family serine peptidase [Candidatus Latescibacterota bacterium]